MFVICASLPPFQFDPVHIADAGLSGDEEQASAVGCPLRIDIPAACEGGDLRDSVARS